MRKHFYLITEHENEDRVGLISITDARLSKPLKNEEADIIVLDDDKKDFNHIGKEVGLGYADFEDEDDYKDRIDEVVKEKLADIDKHWLEKAGHDVAEVTA